MTGPVKTGRLPARICPECKESFLPKRIDTVLCSPECRAAKRQREARETNAAKLKTIKCVICEKPFKQKRSNQECCSPECNDRKQKNKQSAARRAELDAEIRKCKNRTCKKELTPNRGNQVFCSEACADTAGKRDYKERNPELTKQRENKRKKNKYKTDEEYRESRKAKSNARFHELSPAEKTERSRRNRAARDQEELKKYHREYFRNRSEEDVNFKLINNLRGRTAMAIKAGKGLKAQQTETLMGCTIAQARDYIESLFEEGMSWDNWSPDGWHLDHIRPCSSFDLKDEKQQFVCFNFRNCMPLWASENISKNDSYEPADEVEWARLMRELGYDGELFLLFEEGRGGLYGNEAAGEVDT